MVFDMSNEKGTFWQRGFMNFFCVNQDDEQVNVYDVVFEQGMVIKSFEFE